MAPQDRIAPVVAATPLAPGRAFGRAVDGGGDQKSRGRRRRMLKTAGWWLASVGLFAGLWELAWAAGLLDPLLMPPPHIFLRHFAAQARFFDPSNIGSAPESPLVALLTTVAATSLRVLAGLTLAFAGSLIVGIFVSYVKIAGRLMLPTLTLLAPISPVAWLPVAIFLFGIGNGPAVFMVFIGVFFIMTMATVSQIASVPATYINLARTMGATRWQTLRRVILPAILPGLFLVLRMNLFAAWIVVLIAEAVGVGSGLGQVVILARNTFNSSLVFFTMTIIGLTGYLFDYLLRLVQRRLLWWESTGGALAR
ncbi:MAG: ABC transporter permease [Solirubrobacteraceae bacterium]